MNNSLKGALLSGLIFPGLGQVVLKHYIRGALIMLTVLVSLFIIVVKAVQIALNLLEKIDLESGPINLTTITDAATQAVTTSDSFAFNSLMLLIIFCWIIGTIDAYTIGKKMDLEESLTNQLGNNNITP